MAIVPMSGPYFRIQTSNGTNTYIVGTGNSSTVSAFGISIVDEGSMSMSIVVKARPGVPEATTNNVTFQGTEYRKMFLNNAAGDGSLVATAITNNSMIIVPASGLQIALDVTFTSGKAGVYVQPLSGTAAI